ncbi:hypothetical protein BFU36_12550 [Sulfolobus sp. A20]|nr:XdhC family protein [Sulfolobus sp. B1]AOL17405.1 hypothetical protein BFU36_12550 [Sulfolobus sp. A20]TRM75755.1 YHS domain-containing protein [Sulfolobus sp. A20-N-F8]TRM79772.1 YHS domain-containing protein [Sulfolobus sp. D5]TRM89509.1 YHS domain-containing protein [Sulfolobus sp. C3]TRN03952.1 YHS domain-containing protein [Sulfolobus sp. E1]
MLSQQYKGYFMGSLDFIKRVEELMEKGEEFAVVEVVNAEGPSSLKAGNKLIVKSDGSYEGWIGGFCIKEEIIKNSLEVINMRVPKFLHLKTCHGGTVYLYIEPMVGKREIIIAGDNPITHYLEKLGADMGFSLIKVSDPGEINQVKVSKNSFALIATMGERDHEFAEALLNSNVKYIGVVASRKRGEEILSYLRSKGYGEDLISRIKIPAGIDINAVFPDEIAVSILAEIIKVGKEAKAKNEYEIFEDPVCGMSVSKSSPYFSTFNGKVYYFCSKHCKDSFESNPKNYIK